MDDLLVAIGKMLDEKLAVEREVTLEMLDKKLDEMPDEKSAVEREFTQKKLSEKLDDRLVVEREFTRQAIEQSGSSICKLIETDIIKRLDLLIECTTSLDSRLRDIGDLPKKLDEIQATVAVLRYVFKEHVSE